MLNFFVIDGKYKLPNPIDTRVVYVITAHRAYWFRDEFDTESKIYRVQPKLMEYEWYVKLAKVVVDFRLKKFLKRTGDSK